MDGDGDGDAMDGDGDGDAVDGDGDAKTPAETLAARTEPLLWCADGRMQRTKIVRRQLTELEKALMLAGNEDEYVEYLEKKVADQKAASDKGPRTAAAAD